MSELELTEQAIRVLRARYLRRDETGQIIESPRQMFERVASGVAAAEQKFGESPQPWRDRFLEALLALDFLPNSPTLMNAGTPLGQLSACFVLPIEDDLGAIFDSLKLMALIQQSGGGTGFSFSRLRPKGAIVKSTGGRASGPVSFMCIFDCATEHIRQGGKRRGANMGVLRADHPDISEFINAKLDEHRFRNFNLSVAATDEFMQAVAGQRSFALRDPHSGKPCADVQAEQLMRQIAEAAWRTGDPGMLFIDTINRANPTPKLGQIEATNPCGEVPLLPYEACNLGSINLSHMVSGTCEHATIDWNRLAEITALGIRFLDNVIEVGKWPAQQIADRVRGNRKVGLGVMGLADMLIQLGIPYDSDQAVQTSGEVMRFIAKHADATSESLAKERGCFPNWKHSRFAESDRPMRNATRTSIAPTGTLGIIAGTSASIEPLFALAYRREHVLDDDQPMIEYHPLFLRHVSRLGLDVDVVRQTLARTGSIDGIEGIPDSTRRLFQTALTIPPQRHLEIQAAFQAHVDNAVSKTINLPHDCSVDEITEIYNRAWRMQLKGTTIYRYGSKSQQVLNLGTEETALEREHYARCDPHDCRL